MNRLPFAVLIAAAAALGTTSGMRQSDAARQDRAELEMARIFIEGQGCKVSATPTSDPLVFRGRVVCVDGRETSAKLTIMPGGAK